MTQLPKLRFLSRIPIKWKLTIWSAFMLFVLFAAYNTVQYIYVEKWMIDQEKADAEQQMRDILNYLLERETAFDANELTPIRNYLNKMNNKHQLIRVIDRDGNRMLAVSDELPEIWVEAVPAGSTEIVREEHAGHSLLIMRSPIAIHDFNGTVEIVKNLDDIDKLSAAILRVMTTFGLGAVVVCALGGGLLAWQLLKPLQSMADTIRRIKHKGFHERMQVNNNEDELSTLMKMFNKMMDQVERSLKEQTQFVEDASHELRTPVAIIEGHLLLLQRWGKKDSGILDESLRASVQELLRLKGLVEDLLTLTRVDGNAEPGTEVCSPEQAIPRMIKNAAVIYPSCIIDTELNGLANVVIRMPEQHLEQLLLILLDNAVKYSAGNAVIRIRGSADNECAKLQISDSGIGIPDKDLPYVMDRFYRVDKARSREQGGHGLGLAIAKRLADQYDGTLAIESREHEGTTVALTLPAYTISDK